MHSFDSSVSRGVLRTIRIVVAAPLIALMLLLTSCAADTADVHMVDVAAGAGHTLALSSDGSVKATGDNEFGQCDTEDWAGVQSVDANALLSAGVCEDGTVVVSGEYTSYISTPNPDEVGIKSLAADLAEIATWTDIVAISCGSTNITGLKSDGALRMVGNGPPYAEELETWEPVTDITAATNQLLGLKDDGTIEVTGMVAQLSRDPDIVNWSGLTEIAFGAHGFAAGIRQDGTVVATSSFRQEIGNTENWTDIVQLSGGLEHLLGLRSDGTVVAAGREAEGATDVSQWQNIVDIDAGFNHSVGLLEDGTVVAVGDNKFGACDVSSWNPGSPE